MSQSSEDDSVEAWVERVYSYLLNYTLTVKGKISLHYLNYIQRKYIKITKSPKETHFAVLGPSRWEAGTTKSLLWLLGVRRAVRDQNTAHFNPHSRPVAPSRHTELFPGKPWRPGHNNALELPGSPGTSQQCSVLSYWHQAATRVPAHAAPCFSQSASVKLPTYCRSQNNVTTRGKKT